MSSCSKLVEIANMSRDEHKIKNVYYEQNGFIYNDQHPNATQSIGGSDDQYNAKGKGTGVLFDTTNGGGSYDINGRPDVINSGRLAIYNENIYTPNSKYECID